VHRRPRGFLVLSPAETVKPLQPGHSKNFLNCSSWLTSKFVTAGAGPLAVGPKPQRSEKLDTYFGRCLSYPDRYPYLARDAMKCLWTEPSRYEGSSDQAALRSLVALPSAALWTIFTSRFESRRISDLGKKPSAPRSIEFAAASP
jgi:hypothetical protein